MQKKLIYSYLILLFNFPRSSDVGKFVRTVHWLLHIFYKCFLLYFILGNVSVGTCRLMFIQLHVTIWLIIV